MRGERNFLTADLADMFKHTIFVRHRLEEQYRDLAQQSETASFGMWLFLATEVMFFGTLFVTLGVYRYLYAGAFEKASERLNWQIGSINTLVLLVSSLTMVLAIHYARIGFNRRVVIFLLLTASLGIIFMVLKGVEYYDDYLQNLIPGWRFDEGEWIKREGLSAVQVGQVKIFFLMYWIMTVTHAVHMTIGITAVLILAVLASRNYFDSEYYAPIDVTGLYWHFVDIVWIFLLPMLYLLGTHSLR
jgi:cytochrome c oxidase subunit 3